MVKKQRWEEARKCREFDGAKDAVEAYVVRCTRGRLAVLYVHDPVEHARPPALLDWDAVAAESSRDLLSHIRENEWRLLDRRKSKR